MEPTWFHSGKRKPGNVKMMHVHLKKVSSGDIAILHYNMLKSVYNPVTFVWGKGHLAAPLSPVPLGRNWNTSYMPLSTWNNEYYPSKAEQEYLLKLA